MKDRLKQVREAQGLSQVSFAERLGIDKSTVWRWEKGTSTPSPLELAYIAKEFGLRLEWLLTGEGEPKQSYEEALDDIFLALVRQLPERGKQAVLNVLEYYQQTGKWKHVE